MLALAYSIAGVGGASFGLVLPVLPALLASVGASDSGTAAQMGGLLIAAFAVMQLVAAPVFGALSDAYGRKPILIFALSLGAIGHAAMALAPNLGLLIGARALTGLSAAAFVALSAMIADKVAPGQRATVFGRLSAADGAGLVVGPAVVGLLAEQSLRAPFVLVASLDIALLLLALFFLRETLAVQHRRPILFSEMTPLRTLRMAASVPGNRAILSMVALFSLGILSLPMMWAYFTDVRFGWGTAEIGFSMSVLGIATIAANGVLLPVLRRYFCDKTILQTALIAGPILMVWLAFNTIGPVIYVLVVLLAQMGIAFSVLAGMLSVNTPPDQQGGLQGGLGVIDSGTAIIAPFLYPWVFAASLTFGTEFAGMPFVVGAVSILLAVFYLRLIAADTLRRSSA